MNVADPQIFAKAQSEIMGDWHSAPMIAYGTLKRLSAWKMYCRAKNVAFDIANSLSDRLDAYEMACKNVEDASDVDIDDYVPVQYKDLLLDSEQYMGTIDSVAQHPCAYVVCNQDIRRQFGIFRMISKQTKKEVLAAFIDGATADGYGYLKNDDLKVDVVKVNADIYRSIGMEQPSVPELLKMTDNDVETWRMYRDGLTLGLNQMEKDKTREKAMAYSPQNISEMAALCAGIRPAFQSMVSKLINRQHFSYNIPALDKLLQTKELPQSFILYQEQMMTVLQWAGFSAPQSYASIKAIAKKHPEKVLPLKERFLTGFKTRLIEQQHIQEMVAEDTASKVWTIISDACGYGFNSSHATAVALDSMYTAWAKAHHPYETYVTLLRNYSDKGDKARIDAAKIEMKRGFGISIGTCKFHQDNRDFFVDKNKKTITDSLASIKGVGKKDAQAIYQIGLKQYNTFVDVLLAMYYTSGALNTSVIETLIKSDYFSEFGTNGKLLAVFNEFFNGKNKWADSYVDATKKKRLEWLYNFQKTSLEQQLPAQVIIPFEVEKYGTPFHVYPEKHGVFCVMSVDDKYSPKVYMYSLQTGKTGMFKVRKALYAGSPLKTGDMIFIKEWERKQAYEYIDGKATPKKNVFDLWMSSYSVI